ncbi:MAG TPA: SDR family NAD(P)-dependent oxidoreductase [Longimicrobiales bacterium]|nr:SDR family NAD(P)-dependent oxidoreductase [Longimicrobiales bacterium]
MTGIGGTHAFVTGGGRGIGAAIATALVHAGAAVTIAGRDTSVLTAHADRLRASGGRAGTVQIDVADEASVDAAFDQAVAEYGEVGILVNNAGLAPSGSVVDTSLETWNGTIAVNVTGAFLCCRRVLPAMLAAGRGRIVNIASTAGLRGVPGVAAYSASKHALIGLTRSLALEVARHGITVNAVCPGYTDTDMAARAADAVMHGTGRTREEAESRIARASPLGRLLRPEEVAAAVVWLCSGETAGITGESLVVGGEV